jgi:3-oxoacyl-[acyl-carrier protein] reductase
MFDSVHERLIALTPSKRAASLEEIAKIILFLCSEDSNWIVGQTIKVDGGADFALPLL